MEMAGGGSAGGGRSKSGGSKSKQRKKAAAADMPPSDIGKASPTSAEDAEYANDIMGGSDEEYGRSSRSGSSSAGSGMCSPPPPPPSPLTLPACASRGTRIPALLRLLLRLGGAVDFAVQHSYESVGWPARVR
jgi:hypothetical protein